MRICSKCGIEKHESEFFIRNKVTGRLHAQCKKCYKQYRLTYYAQHYETHKESYLLRAKQRRQKLKDEFRSNISNYLSDKSCKICGEKDVRVLELDHIDPAKKRFTISQAVKLGYNWDEVKVELLKCQVLCANCHKRRTAVQFNWYKA